MGSSGARGVIGTIEMIGNAENLISSLDEDTQILKDMANFVINRVN